MPPAAEVRRMPSHRLPPPLKASSAPTICSVSIATGLTLPITEDVCSGRSALNTSGSRPNTLR